jgi:actin-like ATPase involved in cell morphogenesis
MSDIENQIIDKLKGFNEIQQQHALEAVQRIDDETAEQGIKIAVTIDGVDCQVQCVAPNKLYPESLFTPAGVDLVDAVVKYVHEKYDFNIGRVSGKMTLNHIGSAIPLEVERTHTMKRRKEATEPPDLIEISSVEIRHVITPLLNLLIKNVRQDIEKILSRLEIDPTLNHHSIIILRGEFRNLFGLDQRLQQVTGLKVIVE